jgi:peptide/nickel transport system substrate-binding protein
LPGSPLPEGRRRSSRGTAIVVVGADPAILNPDVTVGAPDLLAACMLYDGLVRFAEGFRIVPSLGRSWEISPDGLTCTFHRPPRGATASR